MKQLINNIASTIREWQHIAGYPDRNIINSPNSNTPAAVEYPITVPRKYGLHGKKILFFSDLHFGSGDFNAEEFRKIVADTNPDWVVFAGDLITYACFQNDAFAFLRTITNPVPNAAKVAVYGNWDRRRNSWYPNSKWEEAYNDIGFHLLVNRNIELDGINFYGIDEPRMGTPEFNDTLMSEDKLNCIISHSVDPLIDAMPNNRFKDQQLFLCGHSHGGQIRIPLFGALFTSSKYWKLFEHGHYCSRSKNIDLIMTSGIGTTRWPFRFLCTPELVVVKFVEKEGEEKLH